MKPQLPEVNFSDQGDVRYLHLGTEWIQGSMLLDEPFEIELEYVQRMMAWLLFVDPATVAKRHAMQLGLGAALADQVLPQEAAHEDHGDRAQSAGGRGLPPLVQVAGRRHAAVGHPGRRGRGGCA